MTTIQFTSPTTVKIDGVTYIADPPPKEEGKWERRVKVAGRSLLISEMNGKLQDFRFDSFDTRWLAPLLRAAFAFAASEAAEERTREIVEWLLSINHVHFAKEIREHFPAPSEGATA